MGRRSKWRSREKWLCPNGCKQDIYIADNLLGYTKGEDGQPVIIEEEAVHVRKVFDMYLEAGSAENILSGTMS